jgi:hypothetical protein
MLSHFARPLCLGVVGMLLIVPAGVRADVIVDASAGTGSHTNVLHWLPGTANTTQNGTVNGTSYTVNAISADLSMLGGANKLTPSSGSVLSGDLTFSPANFFGFGTEISINLDVTGSSTDTVKVVLTGVDKNGNPLSLTPFLVDEGKNGKDFSDQRIRISTTDGDVFTSIELIPTGGATLSDIKQFRIASDGGVVPTDPTPQDPNGSNPPVTTNPDPDPPPSNPDPVPEPSSLALIGLGTAMLAGWRWRKRRQGASSAV